ncbi:hypothetical protein EVA_08530 [gut metagenome]|uniref:Uncharacterized protein n=1 Tax=gut metagenome TaxID=749906 RepID=J9G7X7_9ZZZZ
MYLGFCQYVALSSSSLDKYIAEAFLKHKQFLPWLGFQYHLNCFSLAIWVDTEIEYARPFSTLGQVIFLVARGTSNGKTLNIVVAMFAIPVDYVVYRALVIPVEYIYI